MSQVVVASTCRTDARVEPRMILARAARDGGANKTKTLYIIKILYTRLQT